MQPVVIYARVSTEEQGARGTSIAVQVERCRSYAATYGLRVVEVVEDPGASAANLRRPGWARVAELLESGAVEGVVVAKLDRLTRSLRDLDTLVNGYFARGLVLHSVEEKVDTGGANGRLVLNLLMSVAQWEREVIAERTSAALQKLKAQGKRYRGPGQAAFGELPGEAETVERIIALRCRGESIRAIVETLTAEGHAARGGSWHPTSVRRILARAAER